MFFTFNAIFYAGNFVVDISFCLLNHKGLWDRWCKYVLQRMRLCHDDNFDILFVDLAIIKLYFFLPCDYQIITFVHLAKLFADLFYSAGYYVVSCNIINKSSNHQHFRKQHLCSC